MSSKAEMEVELKSSADKVWPAIVDSTALWPKIFPEQFKSIEVVEGDGINVGSVCLVTYGEGIPLIKVQTEKIEVLDLENKIVGYSVVDGKLLDYYKTFKVTFQVVPTGEKVNEEVPEPDMMWEIASQLMRDLDAYLLKN